jgi:hypothetical protein
VLGEADRSLYGGAFWGAERVNMMLFEWGLRVVLGRFWGFEALGWMVGIWWMMGWLSSRRVSSRGVCRRLHHWDQLPIWDEAGIVDAESKYLNKKFQ